MFSSICTRINGWVNNGEAGGLRRHHAHYDVTVMAPSIIVCLTIYAGDILIYIYLKTTCVLFRISLQFIPMGENESARIVYRAMAIKDPFY